MAYSPAEIAARYAGIAQAKSGKPWPVLLALSVLGGAYVALAAVAAHMVATLLPSPGTAKLVAALLFPTGLAMILVGGGELFTGNCMMVLGVGQKACSMRRMLACWAVVYIGNALGATLVGGLSVLARASDEAFLQTARDAAVAKASLSFGEGFWRGVVCNIFVCAAVWMSYATDHPGEKIICMYLPVALFVLCGAEHCVANAFYFSAAFFAGSGGATFWEGVARNTLAVTLGNIGGGVLLSGLLWLALFRPKKKNTV